MKTIWEFVKEVFEQWIDDKAPKLGAAVSFYTIFSLAPLLVIVIAFAGFLFSAPAAKGEIVEQIREFVGAEGARLVQTALQKAGNFQSGILATIVSLVTMVIGATAVFVELQDSLNMIWKVKPKPERGIIKGLILDRLVSFAMVLGAGFLLLVSLFVSAMLSALHKFVNQNILPMPLSFLDIGNIVVSLAVIFLMFAMIFKILPDVRISWSDVWMGAFVTATLFVLGKFLIGLYLGTSSLSSAYGAAGSLVVFLLWVYYSAQIVFLGAEFTHVYANRFGSGIRPAKKFMSTDDVAKFPSKDEADKNKT